MSERQSADALRAEIEARRDALEALIRALPAERQAQPLPDGDWTVKEMLAHVTGWEGLLIAWLTATARGETPVRFAPGFPAAVENVDHLNARFAEESAAHTLPEVRAAFDRSRVALLAAIAPLDDAAINEVGRIPWTGDRPLLPYIAANTYEHYDEHLPGLEALNGQP